MLKIANIPYKGLVDVAFFGKQPEVMPQEITVFGPLQLQAHSRNHVHRFRQEILFGVGSGMEQNLIGQWNQEPRHGMGTELAGSASCSQSPHGPRLPMELKMTDVLKEVDFLVVVGEVCCHVDEPRMARVAFDEGREKGDEFKSCKLERERG